MMHTKMCISEACNPLICMLAVGLKKPYLGMFNHALLRLSSVHAASTLQNTSCVVRVLGKITEQHDLIWCQCCFIVCALSHW